jgi:hypothetical protein
MTLIAVLTSNLTFRDSGLPSGDKGGLMRQTIRSASLVDYPEIAQSDGLDPYKMLERVGCPAPACETRISEFLRMRSPNSWKPQHQPHE